MILTLSKKSAMYTTTLWVVLLQTLTITHMLPMSAPIRTAEELNQMIDPVFQSEQDENQLESKKIVAKSVYNTVIRVTTTPCQSGMQRVKEGGPCVTRYTGSGPVLDEEYQLSILKGMSWGSRRPTSNKHKNRHRTTTTPMPSTTTNETPAPTAWALPTAAENVENEESQPQSNGDLKKVGNVEMMDIEIDTTKTQEPQIHPDMTIMPASSISSPSMSVSIPTPQPGPRPMPTPTMMPPSPPSTNNGSNENVTAETEVLKLQDPVETLSPGKIGSIADNSTAFLPPQNLGIKDDDEQTTETIMDFSTTMVSIMREDEIINFDDGTNTTQEMEEQVIDATTETTLPSSLMTMMGQSVMANDNGEEEDKVVNNIHPDTFDLINNSSSVTKPQNETEPDQIAWPDSMESISGVNASHPQPSNNSTLTMVTSDAPVTIIIPLLVPQHFPVSSNTSLETPHNFTESENDTTMTDGNTRLPDLNGAQNTGHHVQKVGDLASTSPTAAAAKEDDDDDEIEEGLSTSQTSPQPHQLIQINDFEMDPTNTHHRQKDDPTPVRMMEDTDVKVEDIFKTNPQDELLAGPNLDKVTSSSSSVEEILSTVMPSSPPMSLAQEILSRLKPIPHSLLRFHQSTEMPLSPSSSTSPPLLFRRGDITPELILMREIDPEFPRSGQFREEEIDQSHHRSRSRNRAKSSEVLDISMSSSQARAMPSNTRSDETEGVVPVAHFPKMLFSPPETVDYTRLGDKYRRFRVF